jgi:uncharacterized protein YjbI with pentapeptide repeats
MFTYPICSTKNCSNPALGRSDLCRIHHPNPTQSITQLNEPYNQPILYSNLNFCGIEVDNLRLPAAKWVGCNFTGAKFSDCSFDKHAFLLCIFEECTFYHCSFLETESLEVSFARTEILDSFFTNTRMVLSNFNGSLIQNTDLSQSDFTYSRFILCTMRQVLLRDSNLKSVHFNGAILDQVDFAFSNKDDCIFD